MTLTPSTVTNHDRLAQAIRDITTDEPNAAPADIRVRLYDLMLSTLNTDELDDLCFRLDIDAALEIKSVKRTTFTRELITHCERTHQLPQLITTLQTLRPAIPWPTLIPNHA